MKVGTVNPFLKHKFKEFTAVLWSRSRKEPELLAGAGAGMSKFRLRLPALGQLE